MNDALTPDEWAKGVTRIAIETFAALDDGCIRFAVLGMTAGTVTAEWVARESTMGCEAPFAFGLMALANTALPDGDPRKITREDVQYLRGIARFDTVISSRQLNELAAKLAAFLPPEG